MDIEPPADRGQSRRELLAHPRDSLTDPDTGESLLGRISGSALSRSPEIPTIEARENHSGSGKQASYDCRYPEEIRISSRLA